MLLSRSRSNALSLCLALASLQASACKRADTDLALSKVDGTKKSESIPAPPANGPPLYVLGQGAKVWSAPNQKSAVMGELRPGATVARSEASVGNEDCEGGFYAVHPRGFVCADGSGASLAPAHANFGSSPVDKPLPFRYGRANSVTPIYARLPSPEEQREAEPGVDRHLAKIAKDATSLTRPGANDIPVDDRSVPSGPAMLTASSEGATAEGTRTRQSYFEFGGDLPSLPPNAALLTLPATAFVVRKGAGIAIAHAVTTPGPNGDRRFGLTPTGQYVPLDRLDPALGTTWHGVDLTKSGLPIGFTLKHEVCPYSVGGGKAERIEDEEVERRSVIALTGKYREVDGVRFDESENGQFFRDRDLIKIVKRSKFPEFVSGTTKWVDVSLALQTMTLYEGRKPIYATLVSSGQKVLGDPQTEPATIQGTFRILRKSVTDSVESREAGDAFEIFDAPHALEFAPGFSFVGSYWGDTAGEARSFHAITLTPVDAQRLFSWAGPALPNGYRSLQVAEDDADQIVVHIRK